MSPQYVLMAFAFMGCVRHVDSYTPRVREFTEPTYEPPQQARADGSLWAAGSGGLFEASAARRIGDIVTVLIDERSDGGRESQTQTARDSEVKIGLPGFFGAIERFAADHPEVDTSKLLAALGSSDFRGGGSTSRSGHLSAVLPVRVKSRMANGDLYIEGNKVILVNDEETHLYISGVVRAIDIGADNSVPSSRLADLEVEYTGRGVITERQSPGWLARALDWVWPF